jgi:hypothetical protein
MSARPFIGRSSNASTIGLQGGPGHVSQACFISRRGGVGLPARPSRRRRAWRRRVRAARLARGGLAGRKGAVLLGRTEVLLVPFRLARPGLVPVRLCVAAWVRLGRPRRLAWLAPSSGRGPPSAGPSPSRSPSAPSRPREAACPPPAGQPQARPPAALSAPPRKHSRRSTPALIVSRAARRTATAGIVAPWAAAL